MSQENDPPRGGELRDFAASAAVKAAGLSPAPQTGAVPCPGPARRPKPTAPPDPAKTWIEIALHDEEGAPIPGEPYTVALPDGSVRSGTLDAGGLARLDGLDPGACRIRFTRLDRRVWRRA